MQRPAAGGSADRGVSPQAPQRHAPYLSPPAPQRHAPYLPCEQPPPPCASAPPLLSLSLSLKHMHMRAVARCTVFNNHDAIPSCLSDVFALALPRPPGRRDGSPLPARPSWPGETPTRTRRSPDGELRAARQILKLLVQCTFEMCQIFRI